MKRLFFSILLLSSAVLGFSQYPNILISNAFTPEKPSIVIDPLNAEIQVAGANIDSYYFSSDYGLTWT